MKLSKLTLASFVITSGLLLSACGGGDGGAGAQVSTSVTVATIDPTTGPATVGAVAGKPFSFTSGVPALGTTGPTTLTFQAGSATPGFSIASSGGTASGSTRFGSCIFTVATSTYPADHALATGKTITISPCALSIDTIGAAADGTSAERNASLVLGTTPSSPTPAAVAISPTGEVSIGGTVVGKTPLKPTTGAGS